MTLEENRSPPVAQGVFGRSDCSSSLQLQEWCLALALSPTWCLVSEASPGWQVTVPRSLIPTTQLCWWLQGLVAEGPSLPCPQEL